MDSKDIRIFCEMAFADFSQLSPRSISPSNIGRKLGLDAKTVRIRIKKMEESGFIKYYQTHPNLKLFGKNFQSLYRFEAMNVPTKYEAIRLVGGKMEEIVEVYDYLGPSLTITLVGKSLDEISILSEKIASEFELTRTRLGERELYGVHAEPDALDWKIIEKLRYNGQAQITEISDSLSITQRMVQYRIEKLVSSNSIEIRPIINAKNQQGIIFYELWVYLEPSRVVEITRAIQEICGEKVWTERIIPNGALVVDLFAFNLAETEDTQMRLSTVDGVKWCSISILKEVIEPVKPNWIDLLIKSRT